MSPSFNPILSPQGTNFVTLSSCSASRLIFLSFCYRAGNLTTPPKDPLAHGPSSHLLPPCPFQCLSSSSFHFARLISLFQLFSLFSCSQFFPFYFYFLFLFCSFLFFFFPRRRRTKPSEKLRFLSVTSLNYFSISYVENTRMKKKSTNEKRKLRHFTSSA